MTPKEIIEDPCKPLYIKDANAALYALSFMYLLEWLDEYNVNYN